MPLSDVRAIQRFTRKSTSLAMLITCAPSPTRIISPRTTRRYSRTSMIHCRPSRGNSRATSASPTPHCRPRSNVSGRLAISCAHPPGTTNVRSNSVSLLRVRPRGPRLQCSMRNAWPQCSPNSHRHAGSRRWLDSRCLLERHSTTKRRPRAASGGE